jgi:hypothetical protein
LVVERGRAIKVADRDDDVVNGGVHAISSRLPQSGLTVSGQRPA